MPKSCSKSLFSRGVRATTGPEVIDKLLRETCSEIIESTPKTEAGFRDIDFCPQLAEMLRSYIGDRKSGFLFETETGKMRFSVE